MFEQYVRLKTIELGIVTFWRDTGRLPTEEEGLAVLVTSSTARSDPRPYLQPGYVVDIWGNDVSYRVRNSAKEDGYDILSLGPNGIDDHGAGDDISLRYRFDRDVYKDYTGLWFQLVGWLLLAIVLFYLFRN